MRWILRLLLLPLCALLFASCSSSRTIVNALDEREANEILVFLSSKNIEAAKVQNQEAGATGGAKIVLWDIQVPESQAVEAMALLNQSGLPRRRGQSLLNIFAGGGLVPSELQEKIRYQAGLAEQIASTIRKIDGVLDAEVQISFPEEDPLNPGKKKGKLTASVYVKHSGVLDDPNSLLIPKIKRLVAASVPGLDYDNVTVIADRARYTGGGPIIPSAEPEKNFVNIWGVTLAQDSVTHFRILFFSFILALLLLAIALGWTMWKIYPLLQQSGGFKELFHIRSITPPEEKQPETKESAEQQAAKAKKEEPGQSDSEIDET